ncbi:glycosyltransferase [Deinococcus fonticola]|uniref:glycosyltransferase n=1 Tax=Deinococcus fonticola TaxID=2528713 RepID=UPI0010757F81|nr:glycosyltransferase [Deinococcus fonticola]
MPTAPTPIRVLHLTGNLDRGGIETWLKNVLQRVDRRQVAMDIMVVSPAPHEGHYEAELRALGARILRMPSTNRPLKFLPAYLSALRQFGPYDVVHSHIHHFGGIVLLLARLAGVRVRVATSHSDTLKLDLAARNGRYAYLTLMRAALQSSVTHRLAVSQMAARALFGPDWRALGTQVVNLGVDLLSLQQPRDIQQLRGRLNLPSGIPVLGHVGLLRAEKNHLFLLDVFHTYLKRHGPACLLLVGDGEERQAIEARVAQLGLTEQVYLLGSRSDIPDLLWLMDVFVFPSHFEGLSLAFLEAQAAGLPCVISSNVSIRMEASRMPLVDVQRLEVAAGPAVWSDAIAQAVKRGRHAPPYMDFDVGEKTQELVAFYQRAVAGEG